MKAQYDTENVFMKFDDDNSGSLDCTELMNMFQKHGIDIKFADIKKLFDIVDLDKSGELGLEEFKKVVKDPHASKMFKELIKKVRNERKQPDGMYYCT